MSPFGYSQKQADATKDRLDRDLKKVEFHLGRLASAIPQAGAVTSRFEDAAEIARLAVDDLHDEVDRRTEETV